MGNIPQLEEYLLSINVYFICFNNEQAAQTGDRVARRRREWQS
jgi:hypothetical protein